MNGKVIKYNENNINTDLIIPARYLLKSEPSYLAEHCMEDFDPEFVQKIKLNDFTILVVGSNFGCGSSREQAPIALKATGIQCVIAPSFARIFFRNAINIGLPILELKNTQSLSTGDELKINFREGKILNLSTDVELEIKRMPPFLQKLISIGGLIKFAKNEIVKQN